MEETEEHNNMVKGQSEENDGDFELHRNKEKEVSAILFF